MTALLQEVFQKISVLPDDIQDMFANQLLRQIEWKTRLKDEKKLQRIKESASLYAEIYENDPELQELTEIAIS